MREIFRNSYAKTPDGLLLIADGINAVRRWDGLAATTDTAGVIAPTTALTIRQSGVGPILGTYYGYSRFEDARTNVSDLSPISDAFRTYHSGNVFSATNTVPIAIGSVAHGLQDGDKVTVTGVQGNTAANGSWTITFHDENNFSLNGSVGNGAHTAGTGTWVGGLTTPPARGAILTASNTTPIAIGSFAHGLNTNDVVWIRGVLGNTAANGGWVITRVDANNFTLNSSVGNGAHTPSTGYWISSAVTPHSGSILLATNTSPITIGALRHGLPTGTSVVIADVEGNTAANGTFTITVVDANNFTLDGSTGNGGYSGGGTYKGGQGPPFEAFIITGATNDEPIEITSAEHGLANGDFVTITGVQGNTNANGIWEVRRTGTNTFTLVDSVGNDTYTTGGHWTAGARMLLFTSVPVSSESKVTTRQVLRNTNGQAETFYVDIETTDLADTSLESALTDSLLSEQEAQPILQDDGSAAANVHGVPPSHKAILAHHNGRMFYAGDVVVRQGHAQVTNGSTTVTGVGTNWKSTFAGRAFYVVGQTTQYLISSVNTAAQTLTLTSAYAGSTDKFAVYSIRPIPAEHRLIYYSEADLPESVPALNLITLAENDDEIVGMVEIGSYLFILERHHVWRFSMQSDPETDGFAWPAAKRGVLNNRCDTVVSDVAYLLDSDGIYAFQGDGNAQPASLPIQNIFRPSDSPFRINLEASEAFHCAHYPNQEVIRWFVCLSGNVFPRHAIAYNYRRQYWWIEEYNRPITSSTTGDLRGQRIVFLGTDAKTTLALWQGELDGPDPNAGTVSGTVTSASLMGVSMTGASFPSSGVVGNPVSIVDGAGKGQTRRVSSNTSTAIVVSQPWMETPDSTSVIVLGGIPWEWQTGWFRYVESESNTTTGVEVVFKPQTEDALMTIQQFNDYSDEPVEWKGDYAADDHNGIRVESGSPDLVVDLTKANGYIRQELGRHRDEYADGTHFVSIALSGVAGEEPTTVYEVNIDGATR